MFSRWGLSPRCSRAEMDASARRPYPIEAPVNSAFFPFCLFVQNLRASEFGLKALLLGIWSLEFFWNLEFGFWNFAFPHLIDSKNVINIRAAGPNDVRARPPVVRVKARAAGDIMNRYPARQIHRITFQKS
jgi:hypothetical protein